MKLFADGWTHRRMDGRTFETHFIRSTQKSRPNKTSNHEGRLVVTSGQLWEVSAKQAHIESHCTLAAVTDNQHLCEMKYNSP